MSTADSHWGGGDELSPCLIFYRQMSERCTLLPVIFFDKGCTYHLSPSSVGPVSTMSERAVLPALLVRHTKEAQVVPS